MNQNFLSASQIIKGLAIYVILSIVSSVIDLVETFQSASDLMSGNLEGLVSFGVTDIIGLVCSIGTLVGLFIYWKGLKNLSTGLDEVGNSAVSKIALAILLSFISGIILVVAVFLPFLFIIPGILGIVSLVLNIMGFASLQKSTALTEQGVAGAKKLFLAYILGLCGSICAFIPFLGIFALILNLLYYIFMFQGWGKIKSSFAE